MNAVIQPVTVTVKTVMCSGLEFNLVHSALITSIVLRSYITMRYIKKKERWRNMVIYLSGKISGNPDFKDQFAEAERLARDTFKACDEVVILNPATLPSGMTQADYMRISIAMLDCADAIFILHNWKDSEGARIEVAYAEKCGKIEVFVQSVTQ